jgi:dihydroflavonol-4-reductase
MWIPHKNNFHTVDCRGTEVVIAAARKRGITRFLHCSTESILFRFSPSEDAVAEDTLLTADDMPGPYPARNARGTVRDASCGSPTMPIGPHDHNLTPPTAMLRHFLSWRLQLYLDFIVNLVDVRDVAAGDRYIRGSESIPLKSFSGLWRRSAAAVICSFRFPAESQKRPLQCWS